MPELLGCSASVSLDCARMLGNVEREAWPCKRETDVAFTNGRANSHYRHDITKLSTLRV